VTKLRAPEVHNLVAASSLAAMDTCMLWPESRLRAGRHPSILASRLPDEAVGHLVIAALALATSARRRSAPPLFVHGEASTTISRTRGLAQHDV
jgi:hypothetical protein